MTDLCCAGFQTNCIDVQIEKGPQVKPSDGCDRAAYYIKTDAECPLLMPVAFGEDPGTVVPAPDGTDAIGFIVGVGDAVSGTGFRCATVQCTGTLCWSDLAKAVGADPADRDAWWAMHTALAPQKIKVEF